MLSALRVALVQPRRAVRLVMAVSVTAPAHASAAARAASAPTIAVVIPVHNAAATLPAALASVLVQTYDGPVRVCAYDDGSTDASREVLEAWKRTMDASGRDIQLRIANDVFGGTPGGRAHGPAFARNACVRACAHDCEYLCLLDADDEARPNRIELQLCVTRLSTFPTYSAATLHAPFLVCSAVAHGQKDVIVGGGFSRNPPDSTKDYVQWANSLSDADLYTQSWRECTLIQPSWFMHTHVWTTLGGWDELPPTLLTDEETADKAGEVAAAASSEPPLLQSLRECSQRRHPGILSRPPLRVMDAFPDPSQHCFTPFPEDTIFLHRHLHAGGRLVRVPHDVCVYRYTHTSQSWRISRATLLSIRAAMFEERVVFNDVPCAAYSDEVRRAPRPEWRSFYVWGAGRDGKGFYRALSPAARIRVRAFCDIDPAKIGGYFPSPPRGAKASMIAQAWEEAEAFLRAPSVCSTERVPDRTPADAPVEASAAAASNDAASETAAPTNVGLSATNGSLELDDDDARVAAVSEAGVKRPRGPEVAAGHEHASRKRAPPKLAPYLTLRAPLPAPVLSHTETRPPCVCVVGMRAGGQPLLDNVAAQGLTPGKDFWFFV